nr:hypothetical protein [Tanacetum cinerariifolium]
DLRLFWAHVIDLAVKGGSLNDSKSDSEVLSLKRSSWFR